MSYRPQTSSRRNTGRGRGKVRHEKAKRKGQKRRSSDKYLPEESEAPILDEVAEKTLARIRSLGSQIFAFSPFSQYLDDWMLNLKSVVFEFESNPSVNVDEEFVQKRSHVFTNVELKLAERQREEAVLVEATRKLAEQNHLLVQIDREYASATRELASTRNREIESLTLRVHDFEEELEETSRMKASILSPFARRAESRKKAELTRKVDDAKSELEKVVKTFEVEQEKLHDEYEQRKQTVIERVRDLEKKIEALDTDRSVEDRRIASEELVNAIRALLQRKKSVQ